MTGISSSFSLDPNTIKKLNISGASARKMTAEEIAEYQKLREQMFSKPSNLNELKNHPSQQAYATVKVDGKVVATLYNSGAAESSNATGARIQGLPSMGEGEKATGPELAQKRAEEIAKALGGTIEKSSTAMTAAQYSAVPAFVPKYTVDYEAMNKALGQMATPQTQVDTQALSEQETKSAGDAAKEEFLAFTGKSWEEKVRAMILKSMGLEEEDLAGMSAEDLEKIEAKIKEKIEAEIEKKTGIAPATA